MKPILKELLWVFLPKGVQGVLYFALSIYVVNVYSLQAWGDFSLFKSILLFCVPVVVLSMPTILARDVAHEKNLDLLIGSSLRVFFVVCLVVSLAGLGLYAAGLLEQLFAGWLECFGFVFAMVGAGLASMLTGVCRGQGDTYAYGRQVIAELLLLVLALAFCHLAGILSSTALLLSFAASKALSFIFVGGLSSRRLALFDANYARRLCIAALPLVPSGLSFWLVNASDRLIIKYWAAADLGFYSVGYELGYLAAIFISVSSFVFVPYFSRRRGLEGRSHLLHATRLFVVFPCVLYAAAMFFCEPLLGFVYKVDALSLHKIAVTAQVVSLAIILFALSVYWQQLLITANLQLYIMWSWLAAGVLSVLLTIPAVILWGGYGAAAASFVCYAAAYALMRYFVSKHASGMSINDA